MRSRNIKPGFFKNEALAELPADHRLLFMGLWLCADREGRLEDRPRRIKAELFPYENKNVDSMLAKLEAAGFLVRYEAEGEGYIAILKFRNHQNPHKNETQSIIPAPGVIGTLPEQYQSARVIDGTTPADSLLLIPSSLIPDSLIPDSRECAREIDNELVDELIAEAATVKSAKGRWTPGKADRQTMTALTERYPAEQLKQELAKFKAYAPQRDYTAFGRAFASWMGRVTPDQQPELPNAIRNARITFALGQIPPGSSDEDARLEAYHFVADEDEWAEVLRRKGDR